MHSLWTTVAARHMKEYVQNLPIDQLAGVCSWCFLGKVSTGLSLNPQACHCKGKGVCDIQSKIFAVYFSQAIG